MRVRAPQNRAPMSKTFITVAVASALTAALLLAWPVGIINAMAIGAIIGVAVAVALR